MNGARRRQASAVGAAVLTFLAAGIFPAGAGADLIATVEVPSSNGANLDLASFDTATRARLGGLLHPGGFVPAGTNTSANEFHPSIATTTAGTFLAFERQSACCTDIIVSNTSAGTTADVFHTFGGAPDQPNDPALAPNESVVITGRVGNGSCPLLTSTSLSAFPKGPFPHSAFVTDGSSGCVGGETITTLEPLVVGTSPLDVLFAEDCCGFPHAEVPNQPRRIHRSTGGHEIGSLTFSDCAAFGCSGVRNALDPAMAPGGGAMVFEVPCCQGGFNDPWPGLYFTSSTPTNGSFGAITRMPFEVSCGARDERPTRPAFSADGRFLAFVCHNFQAGQERLLVWDWQTQRLLDNSGTGIGTLTGPLASLVLDHGDVVLVDQPVLLGTTVLASGLIGFRLASPSSVGIIVQRVVGRTHVLGRPAPKLRFLGRVPFGHFRRGRGEVRWDLKVGGRSLGPGLYQVTVRSVTANLGVRDLGHPVLIRIRSRHHR